MQTVFNTHFQIFSPLICTIGLRNLWLKNRHFWHECCETSQRLPSASSQSNQQSVAPRLLQDAAYTRQMFQHIPIVEMCRLPEWQKYIYICAPRNPWNKYRSSSSKPIFLRQGGGWGGRRKRVDMHHKIKLTTFPWWNYQYLAGLEMTTNY